MNANGSGRPGESGRDFGVEVRSYHGQPVIKQPVWTWEIPCYFYTGGLTGASAGLSFLAGLRGNDVLARRASAASFAAAAASPVLLISDLGKPTRFLNMLRMFKVTSPMSVGSWILAANGATAALAAAHNWLGLFPRAGRLAKPLGALLGMPLSTYTAALVSDTAVPVWHEARRELPFVFASGAGLSAGAVALITTPVRHAAPARRLAVGAAVAEFASREVMKRRLGELGQPYDEGPAGRFGNLARGLIATGAALVAWRAGQSRRAAVVGGALLAAGALSARWSVFKAGFQSAADPRYVVGPQRAGIEHGRRPGAARTEARVDQADAALGSPALNVGGE